jgi:two-component system, OmpR family, sensor histidine kinase VicK
MSSISYKKPDTLENRHSIIVNTISAAEKSLSILGDSKSVNFLLSEQIRKAIQDAKNRQVRIRYITEINTENLSSCKDIMKLTEVRHLDKIIGNYILTDKEYIGLPEAGDFLSNRNQNDNCQSVSMQNYLFDNLWNNATTQHDKTTSLEIGLEAEEVKIISDASQVREAYFNLIESAKFEISLIIATPNALKRNYKEGIISKLIEASETRNVNVYLAIPTYDNDKLHIDIFQSGKLEKNYKFQMKFIAPVTTQTHKIKTTFLIVDKKIVFIKDVKDDIKDNFIEAVGYATLHTSKSRAESYNFIFDTVWRQADLYESLKEANKNLLYSYEKLEQHDAMEKEFVNLAAHELRTPSQSIIGYSEMLKDSPERNKRYEEAILRSAERLHSLVTNMLNIARIESQTMKLNKTNFDLNTKIENVIQDASQQIKLRADDKVRIDFKPTDKINIIADKEKIFQVFANLVSNALKFTNKGVISISVRRHEEADKAIVTIRDSGSGIDPDIIPHLFSKFKTKSENGLGLGLYISKSIVDAHHGKIEAYNNPNSKGATFVVTLPLKG